MGGRRGTAHAFRVCASTALPEPGDRPPFSPVPGGEPYTPQVPADDFDPIVDDAGRERQPITRPGTPRQRRADAASPGARDASAVVLGRVVHRLFQAEVRGDLPAGELSALARELVMDDEAWTAGELNLLAVGAARMFAGMWSQPALRAVLDGAQCHYEVPLSVLPAPVKGGGRDRGAQRRD